MTRDEVRWAINRIVELTHEEAETMRRRTTTTSGSAAWSRYEAKLTEIRRQRDALVRDVENSV